MTILIGLATGLAYLIGAVLLFLICWAFDGYVRSYMARQREIPREVVKKAEQQFCQQVESARLALQGQRVESKLSLLNIVSALLKPMYYMGGIEGAVCVYLDADRRLLDIQSWVGDSRSVAIPLEGIAAHARGLGATGVAIAHNHPMPCSTPSDADVWHAADLKSVLEENGIRLLEDYVWCHNQFKSVLNTRRFRQLIGPT